MLPEPYYSMLALVQNNRGTIATKSFDCTNRQYIKYVQIDEKSFILKVLDVRRISDFVQAKHLMEQFKNL